MLWAPCFRDTKKLGISYLIYVLQMLALRWFMVIWSRIDHSYLITSRSRQLWVWVNPLTWRIPAGELTQKQQSFKQNKKRFFPIVRDYLSSQARNWFWVGLFSSSVSRLLFVRANRIILYCRCEGIFCKLAFVHINFLFLVFNL